MRVMIMFCLMFFFKPVLPTYFHEVFPGACLGLQMDQPAEFFETISKRFGTSWPNNTPNLVSEVKVSRLAMFIGIIRVRFPSFPMRYLAWTSCASTTMTMRTHRLVDQIAFKKGVWPEDATKNGVDYVQTNDVKWVNSGWCIREVPKTTAIICF